MNIVTSHVGTDFDALASMILVTKLYRDTTAVFSGSVDRRVQEFCNLFADSFSVARSREIDRDEVDTLIVVDCADARRLGAFQELAASGRVRVHVFDHHAPDEVDEELRGMSPEVYAFEPVGATATMLLDRLPSADSVECNEATLCAVALYEETGCLLHSNTTVRDVEWVAELLRRGANLDLVSTYVNRSLLPEQRALLDDLVLGGEHHQIRGVPISVAAAKVDQYVAGVAVLAAKLLDIQNVAVTIVLVEQQGAVLVVGRSRVDAVDLAAVMASLGGGGHHRAASAVLKGATLADARPRVLAALERHMVEVATASTIMTHPVRTVLPETSVADAARVMLRYGHSGLLVVDAAGAIEGIVTRKDVDGAQHHGLAHAPVKHCMTRPVETAAPDTSILELESRMAASSVGRIPIVGEGRLVGIVTRTDILKALYNCVNPWHRQTFRRAAPTAPVRVADKLADNLGEEVVALLRQVGRLGVENAPPCFLVGGSVRDVLLGARNVDLDLLVEHNAIALAEAAAEALGGLGRAHGRFGTAQVILPNGRKLDFATARTEFYEHAAALPEVEFSSIREDLYRRDFTLNTMAVELSPDSFGELIDYFGGERDLRDGVLRVLHNLSFVEDPTRMFRAVRFEQRFGFAMDPQTEALIVAAREPGAFEALSPERLRNELVLLLKEADPVPAIHRLAHLDLLREIDSSLELDDSMLTHLRRVQRVLAWAKQTLPEEAILEWPLMFWPLLQPLSVITVRSLCQQLRFDRQTTSLLMTAQESGPPLAKTLSSERDLPDSALLNLLAGISLEVQLAALSLEDAELGRARVEHFQRQLRRAVPDVTGEDLKSLGHRPGPSFRLALEAALRAKLDQGASRDEQFEAARAVLESASPKERENA